MKTISVISQKGGVGKSTISLNIAACIAQNSTVSTSDTDLQGSLSKFKEIIPLELTTVNDIIKGNVETEFSIIDTPPYISNMIDDIVKASDFIVVPIKAGFFDAMAVRDTLERVKHKKHGIVLTMVQHRTSMTREIIEILSEYGSPIMETQITQRVSYARSPITGSVFNSEDEKAKEEITSLAIEIIKQIL